MVLSNVPVFVQTPKVGLIQVSNNASSVANQVTMYTAGSNGSKIVGIIGTNTDTINRVVTIAIVRSATNYDLGSVNLPPSSGEDPAQANVSVNILAVAKIPGLPVDNDGNRYLFLQTSDLLVAYSSANALANGKVINLVTIGADF